MLLFDEDISQGRSVVHFGHFAPGPKPRARGYAPGTLDDAARDLLEWAAGEGLSQEQAIDALRKEIAEGRTCSDGQHGPVVYHLDLIDHVVRQFKTPTDVKPMFRGADLPDEADYPNIVQALELWSGWAIDVSPTGATGDDAADKRLADAFRVLISLDDAPARQQWIESQVFSTNDFPPPNQPADLYRTTLIAWWLAIHDCSAV